MSNFSIYVSTSGTVGDSIDQAKRLFEAGFENIELSGGSYIPDVENKILSLRQLGANLMLHNYFPPPPNPFVFNLASKNIDVVSKSMELAREAIRLSSLAESKFFALHGGFLIDPKPSELGKPIAKSLTRDRMEALDQFKGNITKLIEFAEESNVRLLVENNVLSLRNYETFGENPLLFVEPQEILNFIEEMGNKVGLLLDIGHLKVSTSTLRLSLREAFELLSPVVEGYHLSENDGIADDHRALVSDSWILSELGDNSSFVTLEIHSQDISEIQHSVKLLSGVGRGQQ